MKTTYKVEGLREVDQALGELPKATGKNVLRRVAKEALQPLADDAAANAPRATGDLSENIHVGSKLSRRQRADAKAETKSYVEMYMGPVPGAKTIVQEFGSSEQPGQPYMRPAWDSGAKAMLEFIKVQLWSEIKKASDRLARKTARLRKLG